MKKDFVLSVLSSIFLRLIYSKLRSKYGKTSLEHIFKELDNVVPELVVRGQPAILKSTITQTLQRYSRAEISYSDIEAVVALYSPIKNAVNRLSTLR